MKRKEKSNAFFVFIVLVLTERVIRGLFDSSTELLNRRIVYGRLDLPYVVGLITGLMLLTAVLAVTGNRPWRNYGITSYLWVVLVVGTTLNLIDWLRLGGILDYFFILNLRFNLADVYIIIGLISFTVGFFVSRQNVPDR